MSMKRAWTKNTSADEYYGNKKSRVSVKKIPIKGKSTNRMSSTMARQVQQYVNRSRETKHGTRFATEVAMVSTWVTPYVFEAQTHPTCGPGSHQRIGNLISPVGAGFKAVLRNNSVQTVMVRMLLLSMHYGRTVNSDVCDTLFEGTAGQDVTPTSDLSTLLKKVNREQFKVLKDDIITLGYEAAGYSSPHPRTAIYSHYTKLYGTQRYHDIDEELPENDRLVMVVLPLRADGDESVGETLEMSYVVDHYWKD